MSAALTVVQDYYDRNTADKLHDYIEGNARIECAWATLRRWAPKDPERILDFGCGIGHTTARLKESWPGAEVIGLDVSPKSLEIARALFETDGLRFVQGPLSPGMFDGGFDVIAMFDVYEHIALSDRPALHAALACMQTTKCRTVLTFPTPRIQEWSRQFHPHTVQPIDENVTLDSIMTLASDLKAAVLHYSEVDVWNEGDYVHAVLGRRGAVVAVAGHEPRRNLFSRLHGKISGHGGRDRRLEHVRQRLRNV